MEFAGHCTCVCALDAVRNIQGASRWAAKAHSQEWLCHGTPENRPWFSFPCAGISLRRPSGTQIRWVGIVPSTSCWAKVFGVPLGLAWRKFRSSRNSGTQYLRMCVVEAVGNIQGASTRAEKRTARNGCATYPALRAGLKSSASLWDSRGENSDRVVPPGPHCTCVCALWRQ